MKAKANGIELEYESYGDDAAPAAIIASGDRRAAPAPTTAATIPGAELVEVPGMGHNLPEALVSTLLAAFERVTARAG